MSLTVASALDESSLCGSHFENGALQQGRRVAQSKDLPAKVFFRDLPGSTSVARASGAYFHGRIVDHVAAPMFVFDLGGGGIKFSIEIDQPKLDRAGQAGSSADGG
jgi:hypothetical protein